ncbi:MAG: M28 family metallopeptidase [Promethearchaeota archaeon]
MSVDENNAYRITERLAFPRLTGSEGEPKAIEILVEEFRKAGYNEVKEEKFLTSFRNWIMARYVFFPLGAMMILIAISFIFNFWVSLILIATLLGVAVIIGGKLLESTEIGLMKDPEKNYETENVFVELKSKNSKATVIFMGHWDTKSQSFSSLMRIFVMLVSIIGSLGMLFIYLLLSIIKIFIDFNISLLNYILLFITITFSIIGMLNFFNKTGNKSPGAYDNAASVSIIIELARYFKENPLENIDFIFLSPGSEELNLGGAKTFLKNHKKDLDPETTYFINFDGIGGKGPIRLITSFGIPRKIASKKLHVLLESSSKELGIKARTIYLPIGAWSDFMPAIQQGFEACWLASDGGLKYVHTTKDTMDLVSKEGLKNGLLLSIEVVKKLNKELRAITEIVSG